MYRPTSAAGSPSPGGDDDASHPQSDPATHSYDALFDTTSPIPLSSHSPSPEPEPELSPSMRPLSFREVWSAIMRNPLTRMWAFDMKPPTPYELLLAQENVPFQKMFDIKPPEGNDMYADDLFGNKFYEIFAVCHALSDGTHLGFALNSGLIDVMAAPFAPLNPAFADANLRVNRLLCMCIDDRMAVVEFCWLKSGALTIRYGPYNSLTTSTKSELRLFHSIYGFSPNDAQILAACALVGIGAPDADFMNANFQDILLSDYFVIDLFDTRYQDACVFCKSRGHHICDCPMPMRRRCGYLDDAEVNEIVPYRIPKGKSAWAEFPVAKSECAKKGTFIFNIKIKPHSVNELVVWSGLFPFNFQIKSNTMGHPTLQKHMQLTGQVNPLATAMNTLKRGLFHGTQNLLLDGTAQTTNTNLVRVKDKRTRRIENVTPPNEEEDAITPANGNGYGNDNPTIYNIQVVVQPNGDITQRKIRNMTGISNEVRQIQDTQSAVAGSSTSPNNTWVSDTGARKTGGSSREPNSASGSGSGSGRDKKKTMRSWDCPECGMVIHNKKSNLNRHIQAIHRKNTPKFTCTAKDKDGAPCEATFQTAYNLKRHRRNAHEANNEIESTKAVAPPAVAVGDE